MRKNFNTKGYVNKKMDADVYVERRKVIDLIYRAKHLLKDNGLLMPRIDVRITTAVDGEIACGKARMSGNLIWINAEYLNSKHLYQIVLHELCHTLWGTDHDKKCLLMHPNVQPKLTEERAEEIFLSYAKKFFGL